MFDVQITRDALGRITHRIEVVDGITRVFEYGYDLAGRLGTVRRNGTLVVLYTYDGNGNRLSAEGEAGLFVGTYDDQDRVLSYGATSYTYAANGELATKTTAGQWTTSYVYDTLGNLLSVTKPNGQVMTYTVDGRGRRVRKAIDGVPVKGWLYTDQLRPIAELDGNGDVTARFVYGTKPNVPEYVIKNGETYRILSDHLGTPRVVVHATTGAIVQRLDVQAFGEIIQDSAPGFQPFGFAGGLYDADTGLVRFGARDYDAAIGRWLAKDPTMFAGRDSNLYQYAYGDAINWRDSEGTLAVGAVAGGIIGAISGYSGSALAGGSFAQNLAGAFLGGAFGAVVGALDPTEGLASSALMTSAGLSALEGVAGNLIGQRVSGTPLLCLDLASAVVSGVLGALGGGVNKVAVESARMISGVPLGILTSAALQTVGGTIDAIGEVISNVMQRGRR